MHNDTLVEEYYGVGGIMQKIEAGIKLAGKDANSLTVDDLALVDEFHTRGRESTLEVAALANLKASDRVLDVGCGPGFLLSGLDTRWDRHGVDVSDLACEAASCWLPWQTDNIDLPGSR